MVEEEGKEWNGEKHPETMVVRHNLGELYLAWGKKEMASEILNDNLKIMTEQIKNNK